MYVWIFGMLRNQFLVVFVICISHFLSALQCWSSHKWKYITWLLTGFFLLLPPFNNERTAALLVHFLNPGDIISLKSNVIIIAFLCLWSLVASILFTLEAGKHILFIKKIKTSCVLPENNLYTMYSACVQRLNISRIPKLLVCQDIASPITFGFISPTVIINRTDYSEKEQEIIFFHELIHIKRHDLLLKAFLQILRILFWFNPAIHLMIRTAGLDIECLCDIETINRLGNHYRRPYAELLLKVAGGVPSQEALGLLGSSASTIKKRIENLWISNKLRPTLTPVILTVIIFFSGSIISAATIEHEDTYVPCFIRPDIVWETPEVLAANEWNDFYWSYTETNIPDNNIPEGEIGRLCRAGYSVYDETMLKELKRISKKYDLALHKDCSFFNDNPERYVGNLFSGKGTLTSGYYFEDGAMYLSGYYSYQETEFSLSVIKTVKGTMSDVYPTSLCCKEWNSNNITYTKKGIPYCKIISPEFQENGYLLFLNEDSIITVMIRTSGFPITDLMVETVANDFEI